MKRQKSNISQYHVISSNVTRKSILRRIEGSWNVNSIFRQKCFRHEKLKKFNFPTRYLIDMIRIMDHMIWFIEHPYHMPHTDTS